MARTSVSRSPYRSRQNALPGVGVADVMAVVLELPVASPRQSDLVLPDLLIDLVKFVLENQLTGGEVMACGENIDRPSSFVPVNYRIPWESHS